MCGPGMEMIELIEYHKELEKEKSKECSICKDKLDDKFGNNAEPINNGRCCNICNQTIVIPRRMKLQFESECG